MLLVTGEPRDEVGALAEHVEQVEHSEDHGHVAGGEQCGQVLHTVVQMPGEAVFDEEGCKL